MAEKYSILHNNSAQFNLFFTRFIIFIFFFFYSLNTISQVTLDFDSFSTQDGFSGNKVNAFIQDQKGFLWVGTWNGLTRYDGYETFVYKPDLNNPQNSLSNREVTALIEDNEGFIWIGTSSGLNRLNPVNNDIIQYPFTSRIMTLLEDSKGNIWIGTWGDGLFSLNTETGAIEKFYEGPMIVDILETKNGDLWVATYRGLINLDSSTKSFVRYIPNPESPEKSICNMSTTSLAEMPNGDIWIGSWGGGLTRMSFNKEENTYYFSHYKTEEEKGGLPSLDVYKLCFDNNFNLWIATWDNGIAYIDSAEQYKNPEDIKVQVYKHNSSDAYSLSDNNVTAIYADKMGGLWVGTSKINRAFIKRSGILRYGIASDGKIESQNTVRAISGDGKENLWVGTTRELIHYKKQDSFFSMDKAVCPLEYYHNGKKFISSSILSLEYFYDGLLIGTDDAGLIFFKKENKSFHYYNDETVRRTPGNKVNVLKWSDYYPNTLWLGTMQTGFSVAKYKDGKFSFENKNVENSNLIDDNIRSIIEDNDGYVWIATQKGLNRYNPKDNSITNYFHSTDEESINDNIINVLEKDNNGNIWIGTNSGLNKVVKKENGKVAFKRYLSYPIVGDEAVMNIIIGGDNEIILGFYENMIKFNIESESVVEIFNLQEYQRIEAERSSSYVDSDFNMFIGGNNGFIVFNKEELSTKNIYTNVVLTDVLIDNNSLRNKNEGVTIPFSDNFRFTHKNRMLTFVFSAMNFNNSKVNNYSYFLDGFDKEWNDVGMRNYATYTNLPSGKYTLKLKQTNSNEYSSVAIEVLPAWWETKMAYMGYFVIMLGLLYFFQHYSLIRHKEKEKLFLQQVIHEKDEQLYNLKTEFFMNIAHELRTPLSLIIGPTEEVLQLESLPKEAEKHLGLIKRNSERLMRLINQLMEFNRIEERKDEIFLEKINIITFLEELKQLFEPIAKSNNIAFEIEYFQNEIPAWIDVEKFEKVIYNLLSNAFKFVDNNGKVFVKTYLKKVEENKKSWFIIEVRDDGIGIEKSKIDYVFDKFYQINEKNSQNIGGLGLYLCKSIVEQHRGIIEVESEHGNGTLFTVSIPTNLNEIIEDRVLEQPKSKNLAFNINKKDNYDVKKELINNNDGELPKLLIVEDDPDLLEFLTVGLSSLFSINIATNGKERYKEAVNIQPDIIVSDVVMPEMDGFQMGQKLRDDIETSHIPIFFLTAKSIKEDEIKGLEIGAIDYIYKPFNMEVLRLKLQNVIESRKIAHESVKTEKILEPKRITLSSLDEEFLKKAVQVIDDNVDDPDLDVEKFSDFMQMSSNQAYRKLKALTGYTAKEFIRIQRLKLAASLIEQNQRNISEIIYMVGFSSPSYFSRCFKEQYGCTPTEYAEKNNSND